MASISGTVAGLSALTFGSGALACLLAAVWLYLRRERYGRAGEAMVVATVLTGLWALVGALSGVETVAGAFAESLRNLGWLFALYRLFASDGRHESVRQVRPVLIALAFVEMLQPILLAMFADLSGSTAGRDIVYHISALFRLLVAVGGLVLAHNLYVGASAASRVVLRWPGLALAAMWVFDLNYFTVAYLGGGAPGGFALMRGLVAVVMAGLISIGARQESETLRFRPSRAVAFQTVSLLLIGGYLIVMVAVAQWLAFVGGDFSTHMQLGFVAAASLIALVFLPSPRLRGWLRVTVTKHLFQHRYDYREEWLRFTRTIGQGGPEQAPLEQRIVQAMADMTDSPSGLLLTPDEDGHLSLAARWMWPTADVPAEALDQAAVAFFAREGFIVDLNELRSGGGERGEQHHVPAWLHDDPRAWAMVPLLHFDRLVGMVVLARPSHARRLDWEDFDLLRVSGHQLASYLAEHASQHALAEAGRFDDFHRRIAFVMHDIKNLASQISLLARNAEHHAENPAFRADMLVTLRNSADKLNALLARLSRYGGGTVDALGEVDADELAKAVVDQFRGGHSVTLSKSCKCRVMAQREPLEQALVHLIQNAIDASPAAAPVTVNLGVDDGVGWIEVIDHGAGMSPEFVRNKLFKPFESSKQGGFGIGAYEARELVRAMNGTLEVESREGAGSRFVIRLAAAPGASHAHQTGKKAA